MKKCLIFIDSQHIQNSIDLLETAKQIFGTLPYETFGVMVHAIVADGLGYFDKLIRVRADEVELSDMRILTDVMGDICEAHHFDVIILPATWIGRMLAPRLAIRLHTGLTADVTEIKLKGEALELVRPAFSGHILAGIVNRGSGPVMLTVRPNVFKYGGERHKETQVEDHNFISLKSAGIRVIEENSVEKHYDIENSDILISGGGGIGKGFYELKPLADILDGQLAASRRIVDKGIANRSIQVGQSGKTVSPKLYMAFGIFGAIQHVEGLKNVPHIIAINTNKNAPICSLSDIVVEGDALTFSKSLAARIKAYHEGKTPQE